MCDHMMMLIIISWVWEGSLNRWIAFEKFTESQEPAVGRPFLYCDWIEQIACIIEAVRLNQSV